jgi:hypothetical protein
MSQKISVRLNESRKRGTRESDSGFFAIAMSASLVAFFIGIAFALLHPTDAHSQVMSGGHEPESSERPAIHLSREFIYLGSRLIAIDEAGASDIPMSGEPVIWSPRTGAWRRFGESGLLPTAIIHGTGGDEAFLGDFDGDGIDDPVVLERSLGHWSVRNSFGGSKITFGFGRPSDVFSIADFDGDGRNDIAAFDSPSGEWAIRYTSDSRVDRLEFGLRGDQPCVGDFDGDGRADPAVWRNRDSALHILGSIDRRSKTIRLPNRTGQPVCADFDGDGRSDLAVRSVDLLTFRRSAADSIDDISVGDDLGSLLVKDVDRDGKADLLFWTEKSGIWEIHKSLTGAVMRLRHGGVGDIPLVGVLGR